METIKAIDYSPENETLHITSGNFTGIVHGVDNYSFKEIEKYFQNTLIGSVIWQKERTLLDLDQIRKTNHLTPKSLGLVDISLWDLLGKIQKLPVYQLLGGFRDRIPAYSESDVNATSKMMSEDLETAQETGLIGHQFTFKTTKQISKEFSNVPKPTSTSLLLLATGRRSLNLGDALLIARDLESYGFHWFECPLASNDPSALLKLNTSVSIPIVEGDFATSSAPLAMKSLVDRVVDRLRFEIPTMGGITEAIKWARGSESLGMNCEISWTTPVGPNPAVHVLGAIRNGELISWRPNDSNLEISEGCIIIPSLPGLCFEIGKKAKFS
ncbi:MAG: enolase C-terminal domain-like protein [Candidatus Latescibacterota bacterium]|nr:enolase C-terminal domain-like protein [Candidatus Latescibacterota bacterium]